MAAPRPKKKTVVKKASTKNDSFGRFKKMYQGGEVKMLANPPPMPGPAKAATVAKVVSRAAKDLRSTDPKSLRNEALRKANRAANQNKPKYKEKIGPNRPQGPEAPRYTEKIGPNKPAPSAASATTSSTGSKLVKYGAGGLAAGLMIGGGIGYLTSSSGKKAPKYRKPAPGANYSGQEKKIPRKPAPGTNYSGPKASGNKSGVGGPGGARALGSSSTAATTAAASGSSGGSQAANVAKAGGKAKAKVGRQTRYQRNELAMEQRKRSSSKPKKSIFSLFRKG